MEHDCSVNVGPFHERALISRALKVKGLARIKLDFSAKRSEICIPPGNLVGKLRSSSLIFSTTLCIYISLLFRRRRFLTPDLIAVRRCEAFLGVEKGTKWKSTPSNCIQDAPKVDCTARQAGIEDITYRLLPRYCLTTAFVAEFTKILPERGYWE